MSSTERERNATGEDESSPLLQDPNKFLKRDATTTPLPRAQLAVIYAIKLVLPVAHTQILPYFNKMIEGFDLPGGSSNIGYYSGLLVTCHTAGQISTTYAWGRLSDWIGRTSVIAIGVTGLGFSTLLFGSSQTLTTALTARVLTGVFSGFVGVIHSVVGELSDSTNQSTAFPFYDIISALGFIIGPLIGGAFAEPAAQFPEWFDTPFFKKYPYILPCLVANILCIFAAFLSVFYLRETHPHKAARTDTVVEPPVPQSYGAVSSEQPTPPAALEKPPSLGSLLALPVIRALFTSQLMLGFLAAAFNTVFVLLAYTPIEDGGLSMNPRKIAGALSIMGFVSILLKASLPIFLRRIDALHVFRFTLLTWPLTFAFLPLLNVLARATGPERSARAEAGLWIAISFVLFMSRLGSLAFSIVMILTKDHTPTSLALGTTNSLSELFQMAGIAIGAPFISSLFAFSVSRGVSGGHLWAIVICVLSLLGDFSASRMAKHRFA